MIAMIGFGEAGQAFAGDRRWRGAMRAFDLLSARTQTASLAEALRGADAVLSLVTADATLDAARDAAQHSVSTMLYLDMNSAAPETKRAARDAIERSGGHYVDVAIMAPVDPAGLGVPLLLAGPHAEAGATALAAIGFADIRVVAGDVGAAAAIKLIRSVMVKGIEALTAEMMAAAEAAGVADDVLASLGEGWSAKAAYHRERMATHGLRRAVEMEEAARTLEALGVDPVMTRGTIARQREAATKPLAKAA